MCVYVCNHQSLTDWLYVLVMSRARFRVIPHSVVAGMSKDSFLEAGAKSQVYVTATGFEPTTT